MTSPATLDVEPRLESRLEQHRAELHRYCGRMLRSDSDADDAVQETLVRAWQGYDRFEGRAALRTWLFRIATNVCLDLIHHRVRRPQPFDHTMPGAADPMATAWAGEETSGAGSDPAEIAVARDEMRAALVVTMRLLPARQCAVLILRDVFRWPAAEVAELLDTSVAAVNSALQRARATLARADSSSPVAAPRHDVELEVVVRRSVAAFERFDADELVSVLQRAS